MHADDLRYLLVEYFIAGLRHLERSSSRRPRALREAKAGFEAFIDTCCRKGVIPREERREIGYAVDDGDRSAREEDASDALALSAGSSATSAAAAASAAMVRNAGAARSSKIARYKRTTAARKRMQQLAARHAAAEAAVARSRARGGVSHGDDDDARVFLDGVTGSASAAAGGALDESELREMYVLALQVAVRQAVDDVTSIDQELPLADMQAAAAEQSALTHSRRRGGGGGSGGGSEADDERVSSRHRGVASSLDGGDGGPPANDPSVDPHRPGIEVVHVSPEFETVRRETVKAEVFRLGHKPPTMSMVRGCSWGCSLWVCICACLCTCEFVCALSPTPL